MYNTTNSALTIKILTVPSNEYNEIKEVEFKIKLVKQQNSDLIKVEIRSLIKNEMNNYEKGSKMKMR